MPLSKKQLGNIGEEKALQYLKSQGLKLITKNFFSRFGEIDLIMLDKSHQLNKINSYLVFIEVRSRKDMGFGSALESITYAKQKKLRKTADFFFLKNVNYSKIPARFDVILIPPTTNEDNINWLKNAF
jgi:putative endonuclease